MEQAGQLLIVRRRLTLATGTVTVDTGITQSNLGVAPDPPVGGEDPSVEDPAGVASRVQVMMLMPLGPWNGVRHSEPRLDPTTGTVVVDFISENDVEINVCFWDPHTLAGPIDCDTYNELTCGAPALVSQSSDGAVNSPLTIGNPGSAAGEAIVAVMGVMLFGGFDSSSSDPVPAEDGWTLIRRDVIDLGGDNGIKFAVFSRIRSDSEPVSWTFTYTAGGSSAWVIYCGAFGQNYTSEPVQDSDIDIEATPIEPLIVDAPSLTVPADASTPTLLTVYIGRTPEGAGGVWSTPAGMGNESSVVGGTAGSFQLRLAAFSEAIAASGPTGVRTSELEGVGADAIGIGYAITLNPSCTLFG